MTNDVDLYINFVLHAIYGLTPEADSIVRMDPKGIARVAGELARRHPFEPVPLYRGVLLAQPEMLPDDRLTWLSWSEDRDVARWFGDPASYISGPFHEYAPEARGYVVTLVEPPRVLWHHSWRHAFGPPLEYLALRHPSMGIPGGQQIRWSLDTQREVITEPLLTFPTPEPIEAMPGASIAELDRRLTPSWIQLP